MHTIFAIKLAVFLITGLFSNHKRRRLWYSRIFTQIPIKRLVPQAIRTPCLKQGFGVSILHDLCCFNLFRLLETWSKHEQEDQSRSFFRLKLRLHWCFKFSRLLEAWSKSKSFKSVNLSSKSTCFMLFQPFQTCRDME